VSNRRLENRPKMHSKLTFSIEERSCNAAMNQIDSLDSL